MLICGEIAAATGYGTFLSCWAGGSCWNGCSYWAVTVIRRLRVQGFTAAGVPASTMCDEAMSTLLAALAASSAR